jgi:6-phosphogluconolactonase (cycloisomerase 2 family)
MAAVEDHAGPKAETAPERVALYSSVGDEVTHWEVDVGAATLTKRATLKLPSTVQYGWPHPSNRFIYVSSTDSERGSKSITGRAHSLTALRVGQDGALELHGSPRPLRQRPIHNSVDQSGRYALTCYNAPSYVSVHRVNDDGTLGEAVEQPADLDYGVFCHQILATPSNRSVLTLARGNNPKPDKPKGDPGALNLFGFEDGRLSPLQSIGVGGDGGYGYGPRHAAFHPTQPWAYVLVELQNQLHMHRLEGDRLQAEPAFATPLTEAPPQPGIVQVGGAIHVHPAGHVVYASNRVSATTHPVGAFPFVGGENNIAVFALDPATGEPRPIQFADPHGFHVRAFTIDPSGRLLIAASLAAMSVRDGGSMRTIPAGLSLFRIQDDGRLEFARRYEVDLAPGVQQMWVRAIRLSLPGPPADAHHHSERVLS